MNTWPDGGMTPFRSEKNTNWEGAFRVPEMIRWPGKIAPGVVSNEIVQHHDWLPTFLAAAGEPDIIEKLKAGHTIGDTTYKVHIDGYNLVPYLTGEVDKSPRKGLVYFSDDGDVLALRFDNWKVVFMEQRVQGTLQIWAEPFVTLRVPKLFNLRTDPFERADVTSNTYYDWLLESDYIILAATFARRAVPPDVRGVPAAPGGRELHDRPGGGQAREPSSPRANDARVLERRRRADGDPRVRRPRDARRAARTTCRPPSASPCSTTTARCGARSRPTSRRCSCSPAWARRSRRGPSWPSSRWSRRCSPATSPARSSTASRRSPACCSSSTRGGRRRSSRATPRPGSPRRSIRASACRSGS